MPDSKGPRHFWLKDAQGFPVACVASKVQENVLGQERGIRFAVSICNPLDRHAFNREKAKTIAYGRLENTRKFPAKFTNMVADGPEVKIRIVTQMLQPHYPQHVQEAARLWIADANIRLRERQAQEAPGEHPQA